MEAARGFVAVGLGALIGALAGREVGFLWVSMVVGGFVGYFVYEFKTVAAAIPRAWTAATSWRPDDVERWKSSTAIAVYSMAFLSFLLVPIAILAFVISEVAFGWSLLLGLVVIGVFFGLVDGYLVSPDDRARRLDNTRILAGYNFVTVYFWHLPRGIWWLISRVPTAVITAVTVARRFGWEFYRLIHSQKRLLAMADAAIGAGIGHFFNNVALGALIGGLWFVLNLEIVSKRVLKVIPIRRH